ncbi:MAG: amidohydrolase family protein [Fimbriimonadaceae bacterium]|nr:MAG: amidohydrolase family protein [Fimbriimonadaceae bacterium]
MILRPYACVVNGELIWGQEVELEGNRIVAVRPHTGMPDDYVLSPAFVNAHSHLEYRGMLGKIESNDFFGFIREITALKTKESASDVIAACRTAAMENRATGVGYIAEHSDRIGAAMAILEAGLGGVIFQELITFLEHQNPDEKFVAVEEKRRLQELDSGLSAYTNPHAIYTVDEASLRRVVSRAGPFSIHCAESVYERMLTEKADGPFAEFQRKSGWNPPVRGLSPVAYLNMLGFLRIGTQLVHCCDVDESDIARIKQGKSVVAHCPRSNQNLGCPIAPVRRMLDVGIQVGLGMDSPASGGPIDMFAEMQCALQVSHQIGEGLEGEQIMNMATTMGATSLRLNNWAIQVGSTVPLIKIHVSGAHSAEEVIERGSPELVEWIEASA